MYKSRECIICGETFNPGNGRQERCNKCRILTCENCGKAFKAPENHYDVKYCSPLCRLEARKKQQKPRICKICGAPGTKKRKLKLCDDCLKEYYHNKYSKYKDGKGYTKYLANQRHKRLVSSGKYRLTRKVKFDPFLVINDMKFEANITAFNNYMGSQNKGRDHSPETAEYDEVHFGEETFYLRKGWKSHYIEGE